MVDNIPKLREEIKDVSMSDLKDFLESIRKHSDKIGETAMKQVGLGFVMTLANDYESILLNSSAKCLNCFLSF